MARLTDATPLIAICARGNVPVNDLMAVKEAHGLLMAMLLEQQTVDLSAGIPVSNKIEIVRLDPCAQRRLERALSAVRRIPDFIRDVLFH